MTDPRRPVTVIVSCRSYEEEDVLGWRLESLLPDDWQTEIEREPIPEPESEAEHEAQT